jgi:type III restriction enzyme
MFLKTYQQKVVNAVRQYLTTAQAQRLETAKREAELKVARAALPESMWHLLNAQAPTDWVRATHQVLGLPQTDVPVDGLGQSYPRLVVKVPTGGGKTLLAVEAIREYQNHMARQRTGLVVWVVPSETIYTQTVARLRDKTYYLRQLLDQCSGGNTLILEKGQRLTETDLRENLVVLFVMIQSISRLNGKDALKVFQDSGGYDSFFPADHRYDLHEALLSQTTNLDLVNDVTRADRPIIRTSLANAIRLTHPLILIDEIHKVFSETARKTLDGLNPSMIIGFSATPKAEMNKLISISGLELKAEEMIKLDLHIEPPTSTQENDWQQMLRDIRTKREALEAEAQTVLERQGTYVRPAALIQVEATGREQRGKGRVHSLDAKEYLIELGVPADQIAIKTSAQNDIEDVDLFARICPVRYIITKEALKEGWDFSFAYVLGIIPNVNSNTSLTQLVGRILRQPYARKFGVSALDESYVYYTKGNTQELLERIKASFKDEGLDDLLSTSVKVPATAGTTPTKTVGIRAEFKQHTHAFYLPVWLMVNGDQTRRRFSYDLDIRPALRFVDFALTAEQLDALAQSLSSETRDRQVFMVTLNEESHTDVRKQTQQTIEERHTSLPYLTRRLDEVIENTFLSRQVANQLLAQLQAHLGVDTLAQHFGFLTAELVKLLNEERVRQEEIAFTQKVEAGSLVLGVSDHEQTGYCLPQEDLISVDRVPHAYRYYLYDDVETTTMNPLERQVGEVLDRQETILWWFRNKVSRGWYAIQGWKRYKIRPDFVAAKKRADGSLELVYVLESKGEHLLGNADSAYKKKVLETMTATPKQVYQTSLEFGTLNENVGFYFVEQGSEEADVRKLMK